MPFFDVKIFCVSTSEYDATSKLYYVPLYNVNDGSFWFNACIPKSLYEAAIKNYNTKKPYHAIVQGEIIDLIIDQDFLGPVLESRQQLDLSMFSILPSDIYLPKNLITTFTPAIKPYTFTPGPQEGYYLVLMDPEQETVFYEKTNETMDEFMEPDFQVDPHQHLHPAQFDILNQDPQVDVDIDVDKLNQDPQDVLNQLQTEMEFAQGGSSSTNPFLMPSFLLDLDIGMEQTASAASTTSKPQQQQQQQQQHQQQQTTSPKPPTTTTQKGKQKASSTKDAQTQQKPATATAAPSTSSRTQKGKEKIPGAHLIPNVQTAHKSSSKRQTKPPATITEADVTVDASRPPSLKRTSSTSSTKSWKQLRLLKKLKSNTPSPNTQSPSSSPSPSPKTKTPSPKTKSSSPYTKKPQ